jgi:glycosyltransferase involved in cell wall biosynthesis
VRIAQIAPLAEACPPRLYGGTERIVSYLTEELVRQGHDVTLFASGDSRTAARLIPCTEGALRLNQGIGYHMPYQVMLLEKVRRAVQHFDVLHFHIDVLHYPLFRDMADRIVTTLHGRLDLPELQPFYRMFPEMPVVSISSHQRHPIPWINWVATVQHGLPGDLLAFDPAAGGGYLAFLGRISPEKGPERAIEIAVRAGVPLRIAAKIDAVDQDYWDRVVKPLVAGNENVTYVGEIDEASKGAFLGNARALLFPIDWPEPFGLVMIEAMACGTPVIAYRRGSVPEVIEEGVTGFMVEDMAAAVDAVEKAGTLDRLRIRATFDRRFTASRMARDYLETYARLPGVRAGLRPTSVPAEPDPRDLDDACTVAV